MTEQPIIISVLSPPSLNKLWITVARGRVRSPAYNAWRMEAGWHVKRQIVGMAPIDCRYDMEIQVPISRRDTGNWEKAISDLLESVGVVTNDGNLNRLTIVPMERTDCCVAITPLPEMGAVRAAVSPVWRKAGPVRKARPTVAQIARSAAIHRRLV